jgi:anti-sigma B factor antagonist
MIDSEPTTPFEARVLPGGGLVVVELRGEADVTTVEELDATFDTATTHPGPILADLTELAFIDSSGLRALIHAHSRVVSQGRRFGVACPESGAVRQVLEMTQLHRVMPVHRDRETAARSLRS